MCSPKKKKENWQHKQQNKTKQNPAILGNRNDLLFKKHYFRQLLQVVISNQAFAYSIIKIIL